MKNKLAFTLIELLIVVAIIGILAAIAVPNFMNAQVRAKISRAQADMQSLSTALESYFVDQNKYPPARYSLVTGKSGQIKLSERFKPLTSPISYMSSVPRDPFHNQLMDLDPVFFDTFDYFDDASGVSFDKGVSGSGTRGYAWRLASAGPDGVMCWGSPVVDTRSGTDGRSHSGIDFDASNGLSSDGDIVKVGGTVVNGKYTVSYPLGVYPKP